MEMMTLLGMLTLLTSIAVFTVTVVGDCDILTLLYSKLGKRPEAEFSGKVVWVTGASSGIGEAIAKELATAGARLVLSARRKKELERVKRECLENSLLNDEDVLVLPLDVTNLHAHRPSLARVLSYFGKLDLLVSNAGQSQLGEFTDIDLSVHRHIFELNVVSVVNMNQIVVKYFLKIGEGHVAVVSSTSGRVSAPFSSAYSASKHAINSYFNALRIEMYGKNIDVTLICPGPVATSIHKNLVTNKPGELLNIATSEGFQVPMMSAERCAHLSLVSIANRLCESWILKFPIIVYMGVYFPNLSDLLIKAVAPTMLKNLKDLLDKNSRT